MGGWVRQVPHLPSLNIQTFQIKICTICLHIMLLLIIKLNIFINVKTLIVFMLLSEQSYGRPTWFVRAAWHHVGDPWFRFSMLLASVVQPSAHLSCIRVMLQVTDE